MHKRNNQQRQRMELKQARADLWDMLNAFATTPDISRMHYANRAGELDVVRTERDTATKRIGFVTQAIGMDYDELEDEDEYDEIRPAEEFGDYIRKIFNR